MLFVSICRIQNYQFMKCIISIAISLQALHIFDFFRFCFFFTPSSFLGQSPIDFFFDLVVVSQGPFGGFDTLATRPSAGKGNC